MRLGILTQQVFGLCTLNGWGPLRIASRPCRRVWLRLFGPTAKSVLCPVQLLPTSLRPATPSAAQALRVEGLDVSPGSTDPQPAYAASNRGREVKRITDPRMENCEGKCAGKAMHS